MNRYVTNSYHKRARSRGMKATARQLQITLSENQ
jgi:hypothetical protein